MADEPFEVSGPVELFPGKGGWYFVRVPREHSEETRLFARRGLVPITATLGRTRWQTSLLPFGDGSQFIALSAKVRRAEQVDLGDLVTITYWVRVR